MTDEDGGSSEAVLLAAGFNRGALLLMLELRVEQSIPPSARNTAASVP